MNSEIEYSKTVAINAIYNIYDCVLMPTDHKNMELAAALKVTIDNIEAFAKECDK